MTNEPKPMYDNSDDGWRRMRATQGPQARQLQMSSDPDGCHRTGMFSERRRYTTRTAACS